MSVARSSSNMAAPKQHKNVLRDTDAMLAGLKIEPSKFEASYKDSTGRALRLIGLPKRECLILFSGIWASGAVDMKL